MGIIKVCYMKRSLSFVVLFVVLFLVVACEGSQLVKVETTLVEVPQTVVEEPLPEATELVGCEYNSDCEQGLLCINKECQTLASLYKTDCDNKCGVASVKVTTSDGEEYDLSLGQGSYSYAGALEWRLMKTPDYCAGEDPLVAVNIIKKTTGKVVGEQVITLHKGETSEVITHPTIKKVSFTATLTDVSEKCS